MIDVLTILNNFILKSYNIYTIGILLIMLMIAGFIDYYLYKIPNKLNLIIVLLRILCIPFIGMISLQNIFASLLAFFFFLIPAMLLNHKMGGDIKCVTVVALFFDIYTTLLFLFVSCISSFCIHFYLRKKFNTQLVPFAPFFCFSHIVLSTIVLFISFSIIHGLVFLVSTILLFIIMMFFNKKFDYINKLKIRKNYDTKKDLN